MSRIFKIFLAFIVSWMFFFPITFTFLPQSINSKIMMAVIGLVIMAYDIVRGKNKNYTDRSFIIILMLSSLFSLVCYGSTALNNTSEYTYSTYVVSMLVWLSAAYTSFRFIKRAYGYSSIRLISNYIIALCVVQCFLAMLIDIFPSINYFIRQYIVLAEQMNYEHRLIGVGISFDPAGIRFSAALIICAAMTIDNALNNKYIIAYLISFFIIFIIGNMLSRTTMVGALVAIAMLIYKSKFWEGFTSKGVVNILRNLAIIIILLVPIVLVFYNNSLSFRELCDFGFEGFINYIQTGKWKTHSSDILQGMWSVWPDNIKTWIIGDGYFTNPDNPHLYYMGTDVGYARLIFYCGIIGLTIFGCLFLYLSTYFKEKFPKYSYLFGFLLILQLAIWIKVSTDIFLILAFYYPLIFQKDSDQCLIK